jgi:outer membrane murein-binding lipoprotein Lpp
MKKIFRMALVFALAGATLMYTGCSKDYTEDINNVKSSVSDLQNKLGELNNELSALKSSVSSLEAAYKAADDLIKGDVTDLKTRVGKVEDAISKAATKEDVAAVDALHVDIKSHGPHKGHAVGYAQGVRAAEGQRDVFSGLVVNEFPHFGI